MGFEIRRDYVNETERTRYGEDDWEPVSASSRGELYRELQREYGRCVSRMYRDLPSGEARAVGWVFESTVKYSDSPARYRRSTWVEVREAAQ